MSVWSQLETKIGLISKTSWVKLMLHFYLDKAGEEDCLESETETATTQWDEDCLVHELWAGAW